MNNIDRRIISSASGIIVANKVSRKYGNLKGAIAGIITAKAVDKILKKY